MKDAITLEFDSCAVGKVVANHFAQSLGLFGPWKVTFKVVDNVLVGCTLVLSAPEPEPAAETPA